MSRIAVIDYGMGNLHSVSKALQKVSTTEEIIVTSDPVLIEHSDRIVLPGVGSIRDCMNALRKDDLHKIVRHNIASKPTLAICVGMQMLLENSEENLGTEGLGIIEGRSCQCDKYASLKSSPHGLESSTAATPQAMWTDIPDGSYFYFVHSYACKESDHAVGISNHGQGFISALCKENIFAVQFHPEKSQEVGLQLYKNFISWEGF